MCVLASCCLADALLLAQTLWHAPNYRGFFLCFVCVFSARGACKSQIGRWFGLNHTPVFHPGDINQKTWLSDFFIKKKKRCSCTCRYTCRYRCRCRCRCSFRRPVNLSPVGSPLGLPRSPAARSGSKTYSKLTCIISASKLRSSIKSWFSRDPQINKTHPAAFFNDVRSPA